MAPRILIHIATESDEPNPITKRKMGTWNFGVYCHNRECLEFMALGIRPDGEEIGFVTEPPDKGVPLKCWKCGTVDRYPATDIERILLTEKNKRLRLSGR